MNRVRTSVLLTVALSLTSCDTDATQESARASSDADFARTSQQSATGHVERELLAGVEKYSFTAHLLGNGTVHGRFTVRDILADGSEGGWAKGAVTCFTIEPDGRTARMGGVVESASNPTVIGSDAIWTAQDNGEGQLPVQDQATELLWALGAGFAAFHCNEGLSTDAFGTFGPSARANVQIRS